MVIALTKMELRKIWPYYSPFLVIVAVYALTLCWHEYQSFGLLGLLIPTALGWVLAWRTFCDPGNTRGFIFSRPVARVRLFWIRWLIGFGLLGLTLVLLAAIWVTGLPSWIANLTGGFYYSTGWLELENVWAFGAMAFIAYQIHAFLWISESYFEHRTTNWGSRIVLAIVAGLVFLVIGAQMGLPFFLGIMGTGSGTTTMLLWGIAVLILVGIALVLDIWVGTWLHHVVFAAATLLTNVTVGAMLHYLPARPSRGWAAFGAYGVLAYIGASTVLVIMASIHCYRHLEVDA